jgi:hypothetical protein
MMDKTAFMAKLRKRVQDFETMWGEGQRERGRSDFPESFDTEEEWWDQFLAYLDMMTGRE